MKTYEIKMNRSRWISCLIAVLCLALIIMMLCPYFTYGSDSTTLVPANSADGKTMGDQTILYGRTWVLSGSDESQDGYKRIEVDAAGGNNKSKLYTTNILRVNQLATLDTFNSALANYNAIADSVEQCQVSVNDCENKIADLVAAANVVAVKLGKTPFSAEAIEAAAEKEAAGTTEEAAEGAETAEATEAPAAEPADLSEADTDYKTLTDAISKAEKELVKAEGFYNTAKTSLDSAKKALDDAYAAAKAAYDSKTIDASYAWVTETTAAYNNALREAYPDEFKVGYAAANDKEFKEFLATKYAARYEELKATERKPENKLYDEIMPTLSKADKTALYAEFFTQKVGDSELDDKAVSDAVIKAKDEIALTLSDEERDDKILGNLSRMKEASNKAAAAAKSAANATAAALKAGDKKATIDKAAKLPANIEKQMKNVTALIEKYALTAPEAVEPAAFTPDAVTRYSNADYDVDELEAAETEKDTLMVSDCTVKYSKRNSDTVGKVTITFANEETKESSFGTSVNYDGKKQVSLMGFVGFPEDLKDTMEKEVAYKIFGYQRNSAVLVPIVLFVLLILGVVFAIIKRDSFGSAVCPFLAGAIGVIAYLTSAFLKLGDAHTLHTIGFAVLLVVSCLQLYLGIKDKVKAMKEAR